MKKVVHEISRIEIIKGNELFSVFKVQSRNMLKVHHTNSIFIVSSQIYNLFTAKSFLLNFIQNINSNLQRIWKGLYFVVNECFDYKANISV